jgi:salicylate hydroxylase
MSKARVLMAGGGIGGLTAAIALIQRGFEVLVYDIVFGRSGDGAAAVIVESVGTAAH